MSSIIRGSDNFDSAKRLGVNQRWQVVARVSGTPYVNNTGAPIQVNAWDTPGVNLTGYQALAITVQEPGFPAVTVAYNRAFQNAEANACFVTTTVPDGHTYTITISGSYNALTVSELRAP